MIIRKKRFLIISLTCVLVVLLIVFYRTLIFNDLNKNIHIPFSMSYTRSSIRFEIATTTAEQERGLSGRNIIPNNYAMLFVFQKKSRYGFWMKDMLAPIDIIWLSDNGTIMGIDNSIQPETYPHVFYAPVAVRYVLEMQAGYSIRHKWHIGFVVKLPTNIIRKIY